MSLPLENRINLWIEHLAAARSCASQREAHDLLMSCWHAVHVELGAPSSFLNALKKRRLCSEHGWHGLGGRNAYWVLQKGFPLRVYLDQSGGIVIQKFGEDSSEILFSLPSDHIPESSNSANVSEGESATSSV